MKFTFYRRSTFWALLLGAIYGLNFFDLPFILGNSSYFILPHSDVGTHILGSMYYVREAWQFPLFAMDRLSTPEGTNLMFTDSIPLLALFARGYYQLTGEWINYFGVWLFACFPLTALFAMLVMKELGVKSKVAIFGAMMLCLTSPPLLTRFYLAHTALMGQFLILWAFYAYLRLIHRENKWLEIAHFAVLAWLSIWLQAYFIMIIMAFATAALIQVSWNRSLVWYQATLGFLAILGSGIFTGWVSGLIGGASQNGSTSGFGVYSMNLLSPFIPPKHMLPQVLRDLIKWDMFELTWDATGGQYEGYGYLGLGVLILLGTHLVIAKKAYLQLIKDHLFLSLALLCLALLAASNKIFFGSILITEINFPPAVAHAIGHFRSSGRYIWPVNFVLIITVVYVTTKYLPQKKATWLILFAVLLQTGETAKLRARMNATAHPPLKSEVSIPAFTELIGFHDQVLQYPSYQCGGWLAWKNANYRANKEVLFVAAKLGKTTNSAYLARYTKDCAAEGVTSRKFDIAPDTLYLFAGPLVDELSKMPWAGKLCREFSFAVACSQHWDQMSDESMKPFGSLRGRYALGETIHFAANSMGQKYLLSGWHAQEHSGFWSEGSGASLKVNLDQPTQQDLVLRIVAGGLLNQKQPTQEVQVFLNDQPAGSWTFDASKNVSDYQIPLTGALLPKSGELILRFEVPGAKSPKDLGISEDPRQLGLFLRELTLEAAGKE